MILVFCLILAILLLVIGGKRGMMTILTLLGNMLLLWLTAYLSAFGFPALFLMVVVVIVFITLTLIVQNGRNIKSYGALLSSLLVFILISIFVMILTHLCQISGYSEVDMKQEFTMYLNSNIHVQMNKVMIMIVVLSMLGAIMDAAMTISSTVFEIVDSNHDLSQRKVIKSGMNVGKDIMGTTVNTLFFATIGEMAMLSILICECHYSFGELVNSKALMQQFVIICTSNIGCLLVIPTTAVVTTKLLLSNHKYACWFRKRMEQVELKREEHKKTENKKDEEQE